MRDQRKNKRHQTITNVVFLLLCMLQGSCQKNIEAEPWFTYAKEYIEADTRMLQTATEETFAQSYDVRYKAELNLAKAAAPPISTLDILLRSKNGFYRKVALVTIIVKKISDDEVFSTVLAEYDLKDEFLTKFYSQHSFKNLSDTQIKKFEDRLVSVFSFESNEAVMISGMPTLIRLDPLKTKSLFVKYLRNGTTGLRRASNVYVNRMGDQFHSEVRKALEKGNAIDALKFLQKID